jgi:RNA polymerase sigma factor (sigma-70 family)
MHVIRRQGVDGGREGECFVHVCGGLSDRGFRRLLSFRQDGPARFRTWLMAVVANLCLDWRRAQQGRVRMPRGVSRLADLDQQVFRCIYLHGMSRTQCLEALSPRFPGLTASAVSEINARLFGLLTPQQRWRTSLRIKEPKSIVCSDGSDDDPAWQLEAPGPGPDDEAGELQEQGRMRDALSRLPTEQRLLLRLRYEQDLTLAEVARLTNQPDPFRTNRKIQAALDALAGLLGVERPRIERKTR